MRRLRVASRTAPPSSPWPTACVLAVCGAAHDEIAAAVIDDLRDDGATVALGRAAQKRGIVVPLDYRDVLTRRVDVQRKTWQRHGRPWDPSVVPVALARPLGQYPVNSVASTVSANLARGLRFAGVVRTAVRPKSMREYAANATYARTNRIEAVAEQLGITSLDTATRIIDRSWQERWADAVRAERARDG